MQKLHGIFFDTSLILNVLELKPTFIQFINNNIGDQVIKNIPGGVQQGITSEILDIVWEFSLNCIRKNQNKYQFQ